MDEVLTVQAVVGAQDGVGRRRGGQALDARAELAQVPGAGSPVPAAAQQHLLRTRLQLRPHAPYIT